MNEYREDPLTKQVTLLSAGRQFRPNQYTRDRDRETDEQAIRSCPFCIHQMDTPPILQRFGSTSDQDWQVCVVPNRYPVFDAAPDNPGSPSHQAALDDVALEYRTANGFHEVVIESPTHCELPHQLSIGQIQWMLHAYRARMQFMRDAPGIQYVLPMKNSGEAAGASLRHCHSQIFGMSVVPERPQREVRGFHQHWQQQGTCILCEMMDRAVEQGARVIGMTDEFLAWAPWASRFAYEFWIAPRHHAARFEECSDHLLSELSRLLARVFSKLTLGSPVEAFNYVLHSQPFDTNPQDRYHWHIEVLPRVAYQAGFEWGTGIHINTVDPVQAAEELSLESL